MILLLKALIMISAIPIENEDNEPFTGTPISMVPSRSLSMESARSRGTGN